MANVKISELTALTPPDAADLVPVTDASASQTKRTTVGEIVGIISGDVDVADDGTATISELPVSKLQDGSARQLLQTDAAGTGVEWTSNVDVPGTLDVTGATTLDSTLTVPLGSAAAPTLRFSGDANTGVYSPGADQVAISTNGTGRLFIDASGRVGVGNSAPGSLLHLESGSGSELRITHTGNATTVLRQESGIAYLLSESGALSRQIAFGKQLTSGGAITEYARFDDSGRLGLGFSSPNTLFHVNGSARLASEGLGGGTARNGIIAETSGTRTRLRWQHFDNTTSPYFAVDPAADSTKLLIGTNGSDRVTLDSSGRLAVGTTSPLYPLHVEKNQEDLLALVNTGVVTYRLQVKNDASFAVVQNSAERLRIDSSGRVGVGTTSPVGPLDIAAGGAGPSRVIVSQTSDNPYIDIYRSTGFGSNFAGFRLSQPSVTGELAFSNAGGATIGSHSFTERARIDSDGRLLVGTSSARTNLFNTTYSALFQVESQTTGNAQASLTSSTAGINGANLILCHQRSGSIGGNTIVQADDQIGIVSFQGADGAEMVPAASIEAYVDGTPGADDMPGRLVFSTTADGASSPTERMRIDSSGRVGVGTTSPEELLHLYDGAGGSNQTIRFGNPAAVPYGSIKYGSSGSEFLDLTCKGTTTGYGNIRFFTGSAPSEAARIDSSGRVGVGTTSPQSQLQVLDQIRVSNAAQSQGSLVLGDGGSTAFNVGIARWNGGTNTAGAGGIGYFSQGANNVGGHYFYTGDAAAGSQTARMVILPGGNVGVGTTSPGAKLQVNDTGTAAVNSTTNSGVNRVLISDASGTTTAGSGGAIDFEGVYGALGRIAFGKSDSITSGGGRDRGDFYILQNQNGGQDSYSAFYETLKISWADGLVYKRDNNEQFRVDTSGRLLIGTSTSAASKQLIFQNSSEDALTIRVESNSYTYNWINLDRQFASGNAVSSGATIGAISFRGWDGSNAIPGASIVANVDGTPGANDMPGRLVFSTTADGASSPTERMRITSDGQIWTGNIASLGASKVQSFSDAATSAYLAYTTSTSSRNHFRFINPNGEVGSITTSASATAYNTSSDYRLKENVTAVTDGITRLQQLKPSRFNFIADPDTTVDGFIAHEVQAIVPEAITGEKDAVDDEGNPQYQGIDQSKLVPLLTAALQEAIGRIEALEAEVAALKA